MRQFLASLLVAAALGIGVSLACAHSLTAAAEAIHQASVP